MNYPDSDKVMDFDPYNSNLDGSTSQITDIGTQLSDEDKVAVTDFINANVNETVNSNDTKKSYYSQLQPNFVEAGSCGKSVIFPHLVGFHSSRQNIY